jgi:heat shock protein HtpX
MMDVRRKACGRDFALSARMGLTALLLAGLYLAALFTPLWLLHHDVLPAKFALGFDAVVVAMFVAQYVSLDQMALRTSRARLVDQYQAPKLHAVLEKLAALADVPKPRAAVVDSAFPNAFAAGRNPERSTVVVTRGLVERLEPDEIEAVLAHELSHIANRDGAVMTFASFPPLTLRKAIDSAPFKVWLLGFPLMALASLVYVVALGIMLTISRCREYAADRGAVLLTGAPEQLMSALQKIAGAIPEIPSTDLRSVAQMSALFILPAKLRALTHPPLERRLARLAEMSRELGKPEPPVTEAAARSNLLFGIATFVAVFALVLVLRLVVFG